MNKFSFHRGYLPFILFLCCTTLLCFSGCSRSYVTPGAGYDLAKLNAGPADANIQEIINRKPASPFPARLAVIRIQNPEYSSYRNCSYGSGRYGVITNREIENDEDFKKLENLPMIAGVATITQILLPQELQSDKELRLAAAKLHTDMLFVYTLNTRFRIKDHEIGPLCLITLGTLPNHEAQVTATASAVIYDVRTGYTYGVTEATATENKMASAWVTSDAIDESRVKAEKKAFAELIDEFKITWKNIVDQYAAKPAQ
jgi:Spy/CpxP family protein refolding chaperone